MDCHDIMDMRLKDCAECHVHQATAHYASLGACRTCHPQPGNYHHATSDPIPLSACGDCHDGTIASSKRNHGALTACTACHDGMDRPAVPATCVRCHSSSAHPEAKQIAFTNDISCADARCHGSAALHSATPQLTKTCADCHTPHYQAIGVCSTCHPDTEGYHHGTATAAQLATCTVCHDGSIAAAKASHHAFACSVCHIGMKPPTQPGVCSMCHFRKYFGTRVCTGCHSSTGMFGREQAHAASPRPVSDKTCTECHAPMYADQGACSRCHLRYRETHHGVLTSTAVALTVAVAPGTAIDSGASAVLSGKVVAAGGTPLANAAVQIQARRVSSPTFVDLKAVETGADGAFSLSVQPVAATEYRAVWRGSANASRVYAPAVATLVIRVRTVVTLVRASTKSRLRVRKSIAFSGSVAPSSAALAGGKPGTLLVRIQRKAPKARGGVRWKPVRTITVPPTDSGSWAASWRPLRPGVYRVRAEVAPTEELLGATTTWRNVRVRR